MIESGLVFLCLWNKFQSRLYEKETNVGPGLHQLRTAAVELTQLLVLHNSRLLCYQLCYAMLCYQLCLLSVFSPMYEQVVELVCSTSLHLSAEAPPSFFPLDSLVLLFLRPSPSLPFTWALSSLPCFRPALPLLFAWVVLWVWQLKPAEGGWSVFGSCVSVVDGFGLGRAVCYLVGDCSVSLQLANGVEPSTRVLRCNVATC